MGWFEIARILILAQVLISVAATIWNLPGAYRSLLNYEPGPGFQGWSREQIQTVVQGSGLDPVLLARLIFAFSLFCLLCFWGIAALLAWRKSDHWFGLLVVYILASTGPGFSFLNTKVDTPGNPFFTIYQSITLALIWPTFFVLLYLFPDGRFVPRWTRWLAPLPYLIFLSADLFDPQSLFLTKYPWLFILPILYGVGGIASQVYRFQSASTPPQRQQTKWVVLALGLLIAGVVSDEAALLFNPGLRIGTSERFWFDLWNNYLLGTVMAALIPIAMGISILRYRLWDIDLIIRRTLLYALLSGLLGLVYFGSVVLLRQVLGGLTGESSVVLVLSTLLIAALFNPLRRRLQAAIDRRFFRQKYDAARALEGFSSVVRNEVELVALTGSLAAVVAAAIQPQSISLWVKPPQQAIPVPEAEVGDAEPIAPGVQESP